MMEKKIQMWWQLFLIIKNETKKTKPTFFRFSCPILYTDRSIEKLKTFHVFDFCFFPTVIILCIAVGKMLKTEEIIIYTM